MTTPTESRPGLRGRWDEVPAVAKLAGILALLGFVVRISRQSSPVSNRNMVECS